MFRISFFRLFTLLRRPEDRFELDFDPLPAEFDPADPDPHGCSRLLLELLLEFFIFLRTNLVALKMKQKNKDYFFL